MCLTAPVRVVSVDGAMATVTLGGQERSASTLAVPEVRPGDWAILAAGMLVRVLDPEQAAALSEAYQAAFLSEPPSATTTTEVR